MKNTTTIINWIVQSGLLVWLFYFALGIAEPWVTSHIKHAKTMQEREAWELLERVAMTVVNSLVSSNSKGEQKFNEATNQTLAFLDNHGIHVDKRTVQSAVQAAYEKSPLTPTSITPQETPVSRTLQDIPGMQATPGAPVKASQSQSVPVTLASQPTAPQKPLSEVASKKGVPLSEAASKANDQQAKPETGDKNAANQ